MIYLTEFDPENYFFVCEVEFVSDGGVKKVINIPVSIDITKFMNKLRPRSTIKTEE